MTTTRDASLHLMFFCLSACALDSNHPSDKSQEHPNHSVAPQSATLLEHEFFDRCTSGQMAYSIKINALLSSVVRSNAFAQCVAAVMNRSVNMTIENTPRWFGPYEPCVNGAGDPPVSDAAHSEPRPFQIARALTAARTRMTFMHRCVPANSCPTPTPNGSCALGIGGINGASHMWHSASLEDGPGVQYAPGVYVILHEHLHNLGYWHECNGTNADQAITNIVGACAANVVVQSQSACRAPTEELNDCDLARGKEIVRTWSANAADGTPQASGPCECVSGRAHPVRARDEFGHSVAVGDFNGDGRDDAAVGVPGKETGAGVIDVFRGSDLGLIHWHRISQRSLGMTPRDWDAMGFSLAAGDFNRDGADDLAIGSPTEDIGVSQDAGRVVVVPGCRANTFDCPGARDGLQATFAQHLTQSVLDRDEANDRFGWSLATGDYDGDGAADLAVGAPFEDLAQYDTVGAVYVYRGRAFASLRTRNFVRPATQITIGNQQDHGQWFGASVAFFNGNGDNRDELAIGIPGRWQGRGSIVLADVAFDPSTRRTSAALVDLHYGANAPSNANFGWSLAKGNFRGGPEEDLAIGAPNAWSHGAVFTLEGRPDWFPSSMRQVRASSHRPGRGDLFGGSLAFVPRGSARGYGSLVIGAPRWSAPRNPSANPGRILMTVTTGTDTVTVLDSETQASLRSYSGHPACPQFPIEDGNWMTCPIDSPRMLDVEGEGELGRSVAVGDFNGDGLFEIAAGTPLDGVPDFPSGQYYRTGSLHIFPSLRARRSGRYPAGSRMRLDQTSAFHSD